MKIVLNEISGTIELLELICYPENCDTFCYFLFTLTLSFLVYPSLYDWSFLNFILNSLEGKHSIDECALFSL